jgi:dual oxidase
MTSFHVDPSLHDDKGKIKSRIDCIVTYLEENRQNIFYLFVFYVITIALFVHQFICKRFDHFKIGFIFYYT